MRAKEKMKAKTNTDKIIRIDKDFSKKEEKSLKES